MNNYFQIFFSFCVDNKFLKNFKTIEVNLISEQKKNPNLNNFEIQMNEFSKTQLDSNKRNNLNEERFLNSTNLSKKNLKNSDVLEISSGARRYAEILKKHFKAVITVEPNDTIFNYYNNNKCKNIFFLKCNIYHIPFKNNSFDFII